MPQLFEKFTVQRKLEVMAKVSCRDAAQSQICVKKEKDIRLTPVTRQVSSNLGPLPGQLDGPQVAARKIFKIIRQINKIMYKLELSANYLNPSMFFFLNPVHSGVEPNKEKRDPYSPLA